MHACAFAVLSWLTVAQATEATPTAQALQVEPSAPPARDRGPREALAKYLQAIDDGQFEDAAHYMALTPEQLAAGPRLAQQLAVVLERFAAVDVEAVSAKAWGSANDGLPSNQEEVALVSFGARYGSEPVRMQRRAGTTQWVFAEETVEAVPRWYRHVPHSWFTSNMPLSWWRNGPWGLPWWQWVSWPSTVVLAVLAGILLGRATRWLLCKLVRQTPPRWDEALIGRLGGPLSLVWAAGLVRVFMFVAALKPKATELTSSAARLGVIIAVFWGVARAIDVMRDNAANIDWTKRHRASRSLMPLLARIMGVLVWAAALLVLLSELGYSVTSLVAGLGLGGLAFALAAQKTVENLFGAFSISIDEPFHEGDLVRIDGITGTVEAIGLRSTKIRTPDRTLVNMPNGKLADMRLESISARDRFRLKCVIGLVHETTAAQMRTILAEVEAVLRNHPKIWPNDITVQFTDLATSSLTVEVGAWFQTTDAGEFAQIRQEVLLEFMGVVERAGTTLAIAPIAPAGGPAPARV